MKTNNEVLIPLDHNDLTPSEAIKRGNSYTSLCPWNRTKLIYPKAVNSNKVTEHFACEPNMVIRDDYEINRFHLKWQLYFETKCDFEMEYGVTVGNNYWFFDNWKNGIAIEVVNTCFGSLREKAAFFSFFGKSDKLFVVMNETSSKRFRCELDLLEALNIKYTLVPDSDDFDKSTVWK